MTRSSVGAAALDIDAGEAPAIDAADVAADGTDAGGAPAAAGAGHGRHRPTLRAMTAPLLALGSHLRGQRQLFAGVVAVEVAAGLAAMAASVLGVRAGSAVAIADPRAGAAVVLLAVVVLLVGVLSWTDSWLAHVLAYRVIDAIRADVHRALRRLAGLGLGRRRSGDVAAAAMSDAEALEWFYAHTLAQLLASTLVAGVGSAVAFAWLGPLAAVIVAGQVALLSIPLATAALSVRQGADLRAAVADLSAVVVEARHSAREMVLLGRLPAHHEQIRRGTGAVQRGRRRIAIRLAVEQAATELVSVAVLIGILLGCAVAVGSGRLAAVDLPTATALAGAALVPVVLAAGGLQRLGEMSGAAARIVAVLDAAKPAAPLPAPPRQTRPGPADKASPHPHAAGNGRIDVQDLVVRYPGGPDVLRGVSTHIEPGESVALVGASGAGKTTLVHALARLVDPSGGRILLDGRDIAQVPPEQTRARVFLVEQQPYVFRTSLRDNLDLAGAGRTDRSLWAALSDVGLAEHVRALPGGLDAVIAEAGRSWSGGQRQRLGIARGLLADPDVLVLDEPTAAVDSLTEQDLLAALARRRAGRTTLIVSHRPTTIAGCARVLFLHEGGIAATGTHHDLVRADARYRAVLRSGRRRAGTDPESPRPERR